MVQLTITNGVERGIQNDRGIFKYCCRYFFHARDLDRAWHCLGIREMLLRQPVFLTFATPNKFCNNVPTSRIDTADTKLNNTDMKLSPLAGDETLHTHVPD
jgi:hypothetical protein